MQLSLAPFSSRPPPVDWLICAISKCPLALGSEGLNAAAAVPPVNCQVGNHSAVLSLSAVLTQSLIFASCPLPFLLLCLGIHHQYQHFFPQPSCLLASWWNGNTYCSREAPPLFHYASSWEDECQFSTWRLGTTMWSCLSFCSRYSALSSIIVIARLNAHPIPTIKGQRGSVSAWAIYELFLIPHPTSLSPLQGLIPNMNNELWSHLH